MPEGLAHLSKSLASGKLKQLSGELATATGNGVPLSQALRDASVKVPPVFTAMIQCGETTGSMTQMLNYAMENARRIRNHRASLTTMFVYPTVVFIVFFLLLLFLLICIVPQFIGDQRRGQWPAIDQCRPVLDNVYSAATVVLVAFGVHHTAAADYIHGIPMFHLLLG